MIPLLNHTEDTLIVSAAMVLTGWLVGRPLMKILMVLRELVYIVGQKRAE